MRRLLYADMRPLFERLYDAIGLSPGRALAFDNRLFSLCCQGATTSSLLALLDDIRESAMQQDVLLRSELQTADEYDPFEAGVSVFDQEHDYNDDYNMTESEGQK